MGRPDRRHYGKSRAAVASVARERIEILIENARKNVEGDESLSRRYVELARKISERTKVRIPSELKRYLCKSCGIALVPGSNARIRLHARSGGLVITCLSCGTVKRYPVTAKTGVKDGPCSMKPYIAQNLPFPKKKFQD
ncbi:ribonuclease P [Candidatus Bathyarchaeota archaeon]|nr:ribonuclease P [Candidatus Bathyarchaeota archaeon]